MAKKDPTDLSVEERLKVLYQLQTTLSAIDEERALRGELPLEVQDLEDEIAGLTTRVVKIKNDIKEFEDAIKQKKAEINEAQASVERYIYQPAAFRSVSVSPVRADNPVRAFPAVPQICLLGWSADAAGFSKAAFRIGDVRIPVIRKDDTIRIPAAGSGVVERQPVLDSRDSETCLATAFRISDLKSCQFRPELVYITSGGFYGCVESSHIAEPGCVPYPFRRNVQIADSEMAFFPDCT